MGRVAIVRTGESVLSWWWANYYEMLGVEPDADRKSIESALAKAQPAWSAGTRNPKNKHTFQSYLDRIPALRRTLLGDESSRAAYDAELAAARRAAHDAKLDELQRLIRLRAAKGGLTVSDRTLLKAEAHRLGAVPAEFDRLTQPYPPTTRGARPRSPPSNPRRTCSTRPREGRFGSRWTTSASATCMTP